MTDLTNTLTILSAMITPVVLIMASSSLILSTSQRLSRSIERTRKITDRMNALISQLTTFHASPELIMLFGQLKLSSHRARLLQIALSILYATLFLFIASCISIAIVSLYFPAYAWVAIALDIIGIIFLFAASVILMKESRLALSAVNGEMDFTLSLFQEKFSSSPSKSRWAAKIKSILKFKCNKHVQP